MKRIHLFEFEDLAWFPNWIRIYVTRLIVVMHRLLNSPDDITKLLLKIIDQTKEHHIVDLCSGSGGPMVDVFHRLRTQENVGSIKLTLTDLYPNLPLASRINNSNTPRLTYLIEPTNAKRIDAKQSGIRTMIGSFHHMKPNDARDILKNARDSAQPICIYEISDNSLPTTFWWLSIPMIFLMSLFITPLVRPLSFRQLIFTYIIPVIPFFFAWDGAVSNVRTYSLKDMDKLIDGLETKNYTWEKGLLTGRGKKLYLLGIPKVS